MLSISFWFLHGNLPFLLLLIFACILAVFLVSALVGWPGIFPWYGVPGGLGVVGLLRPSGLRPGETPEEEMRDVLAAEEGRSAGTSTEDNIPPGTD